MNIASLLTRSAASHGSRIALRQGPSSLTYTELSEQASRFGSGVRALGLPRGARIALHMKNRAEYVIALVGAFRAGLVAVPINVRLHPSELDYSLPRQPPEERLREGLEEGIARPAHLGRARVIIALATSAAECPSRKGTLR